MSYDQDAFNFRCEQGQMLEAALRGGKVEVIGESNFGVEFPGFEERLGARPGNCPPSDPIYARPLPKSPKDRIHKELQLALNAGRP